MPRSDALGAAVDAVFEEFGQPGTVLLPGGETVSITVRRLRADWQAQPLTSAGWLPAPDRQAQPRHISVRRSELPNDPSGGRLELDGALYDIGRAAADAAGRCWTLPLAPAGPSS